MINFDDFNESFNFFCLIFILKIKFLPFIKTETPVIIFLLIETNRSSECSVHKCPKWELTIKPKYQIRSSMAITT